MPALRPQLERITLEQYETMPEDFRAEVFGGQVYDLAAPSQEHQTISTELTMILNSYVRSRKGGCRTVRL